MTLRDRFTKLELECRGRDRLLRLLQSRGKQPDARVLQLLIDLEEVPLFIA